MKYAQIKNNAVANIIVLEDPSLKQLFGSESGFDAIVRIDTVSPQPSIGWVYNPDTMSFSEV